MVENQNIGMGFPLTPAGMTFIVSSPHDFSGDPATAVNGDD